MQKLVTLLCVLVICLSVFNGASACGKCPDNYIATRTYNDIMRSIGNEGHQLAIEFATVCTICGQLRGFAYVYKGEIVPHESAGQGYDQQQLYSQCAVCYGQFKTTAASVPMLPLRRALFQLPSLNLLEGYTKRV